ncbi:MAG: hypothetical protein HZB53_15290 [Chloroflexi bacterium]|nr:hypothetical protein [Chloroflexota bacterium]
MRPNKKFTVAASMLVLLVLLASFSTPPVAHAATTITVSPAAMNGWVFSDDGVAGVGVANFMIGPGTPPSGAGSVHFVLDATARETISTMAYANTKFSTLTTLQYATYRASVDAGNNLAVALQFDFDNNLDDLDTGWKGRMVFEPYMAAGGTVLQNTWQTWDAMTGKWWGSNAAAAPCLQASPCTWAQVLSNFPNGGIRAGGYTHLKAGGPAPGFEGYADKLIIGVSGAETTYDFESSSNAGLYMSPSATAIPVGGTATFGLNVASINNLYGYQFSTSHTANVSAVAAFYNGFFTTLPPAFIPTAWNKDCSSGTACKFAVSHVDPQLARTGSGMLASVTYTGLTPGTVPLAFSGDILSDKNGNAIAHSSTGATLIVYGYGTVYGMVNLQGRAAPLDATGTVTLTDASAFFPPVVATYGPLTGNYTVTVPAQAGGTTYNLAANHSLYLHNTLTAGGPMVTPGGSATVAATLLKGGDATNDGAIDVTDLTCIGGAFGGAPTLCGTTGSSDINADGVVNILDLVLAGGNYGLAAPQPW